MKPAARPALIALALAAAAVVVGCGAPAGGTGSGPTAPVPPAGAPFLATSLVTPAGTWAIAVMGGSVASHNNFWQLFNRPAGSTTWKLVTPPGVADNGGLVAAATGRSLITGIRPSQYLTYTPLALTRDGGQAWSPTGPLDAALAATPEALAAAPRTGHLLALLTNGAVKVAVPGYTRWNTLATRGTLAATPAGRRCGLTRLTAAAFSPLGMPLLAGTCSHRGTAGVFALTGGTWRLAGPALPASLAGRAIRVLGLTVAGHQETALLAAGAGRGTVLVAGWSASGGRWALSPALPLGGAQVGSVSAGPGGAIGIVLNGRAGVTLGGPGSPWQWLPFLPAGTQALTLGPRARVDALAAAGTTFTDWAWAPGSAGWAKTQTLQVPVQYGSSG